MGADPPPTEAPPPMAVSNTALQGGIVADSEASSSAAVSPGIAPLPLPVQARSEPGPLASTIFPVIAPRSSYDPWIGVGPSPTIPHSFSHDPWDWSAPSHVGPPANSGASSSAAVSPGIAPLARPYKAPPPKSRPPTIATATSKAPPLLQSPSDSHSRPATLMTPFSYDPWD